MAAISRWLRSVATTPPDIIALDYSTQKGSHTHFPLRPGIPSAQHQVELRGELKKTAREAGTPSRLVCSNLLFDSWFFIAMLRIATLDLWPSHADALLVRADPAVPTLMQP